MVPFAMNEHAPGRERWPSWKRGLAVLALLCTAVPVLAQPAPVQSPPRGAGHGAPKTWWDGAHGHGRSYPAPGWRVPVPPQRSRVVIWAGVNYSFFNGVWYSPLNGAYAVVRPPFGVVVDVLPEFRTAVVIGGLTYFYLNGVYYREHASGGYEVVPPPVAGTTAATGSDKLFVYPSQNQNAERQASDEYECHRWAADKTGFDPSAAAAGQSVRSNARADYARAQTACLEGRGYTVR